MRIKSPATLASLYMSEAELAEPGPGEILMRVRASSLNYHDYAVVTGILPVADDRIPLSDGAGEIIAVGRCVTSFAVGDHVIGTFFQHWPDGSRLGNGFEDVPGDGIDGFARRHALVPEGALTRIPRGFGFDEAATLACAGVTAWRALAVNGAVRSGETVLVQGTGGVSVFALQLAKSAGATVIATSSSDEKLHKLRELGADHLINYRTTPDWGAAAFRLTGGVDHVVEIGGAGTLPQSIAAVRNGGHIALIGALTGREGIVPTALLMRKQVRLLGLTVGSRKHQLDLIRAVEANGIQPVIDSSYPLEELAEAFRHQIAGRHFGKICISI
jgi:NADPH:quinone reductase-like Zn-dependent oxidoreductase